MMKLLCNEEYRLELIYCSDAAHLLKHGAEDCITWLWLQSIVEYLLYSTVELLLLIRGELLSPLSPFEY